MTDDPLADAPFSYQSTKDGKVFVMYRGRRVTVLSGRAASRFLARVRAVDDRGAQLEMARVTKNFKTRQRAADTPLAREAQPLGWRFTGKQSRDRD